MPGFHCRAVGPLFSRQKVCWAIIWKEKKQRKEEYVTKSLNSCMHIQFRQKLTGVGKLLVDLQKSNSSVLCLCGVYFDQFLAQKTHKRRVEYQQNVKPWASLKSEVCEPSFCFMVFFLQVFLFISLLFSHAKCKLNDKLYQIMFELNSNSAQHQRIRLISTILPTLQVPAWWDQDLPCARE